MGIDPSIGEAVYNTLTNLSQQKFTGQIEFKFAMRKGGISRSDMALYSPFVGALPPVPTQGDQPKQEE